MLSTRPPPITSMPPIGTTQGAWSDAAPTLIRPRRSKTPYIAGAVGAVALAVASIVFAARSTPPVVGIASRAGVIFSTSLARSRDRVELVKAEARLEEQRKEAEAKAAKAAQEAKETPSGASTSTPASVAGPAKKGGKGGKKDDPHGGVEGPGF